MGSCNSAKIPKTLQSVTRREAYEEARQSLGPLYPGGELKAICDILFEDVFGISSKDLLADPDHTFYDVAGLRNCIGRLKGHEPVQHLAGFQYFLGLKIRVSPHVLIPRPETEELVEWVINSVRKERELAVADICTGSGCIALAMRAAFPDAAITATDISVDALDMARKSETDNFGSHAISFERHNILAQPWSYEIPHIVICNPPYIQHSESALMDENVVKYEPHKALFVDGDDPLLFYRKVIQTFSGYPGLRIFFELNPLTSDTLEIHCRNAGLHCTVRKDMQGKPRFALISF